MPSPHGRSPLLGVASHRPQPAPTRNHRLAYIGNFQPELPPADRYSTEGDIAEAFEHLGWDVQRVQEDQGARYLAQRGIDADLVLYTRTRGLAVNPDVWRRLESSGVATAGFHLDLFVGLERERLIRDHDPMFGVGHLFTADGNSGPAWDAAGIRHTWCLPAVAARHVGAGEANPAWDCDVLFVGSRDHYHPQWPRRPLLVNAAIDRWGDRFRWVGPETNGRQVRGRELADLIASTKVVLGDSLMLGGDRYWSDRVPETLGRGGVLVHPTLHADSGFRLGEHYWGGQLDVAGTLDDVDRLLAAPDTRSRLAWSAHYETALRHTYTHRVREIIVPALAKDRPHLMNAETALRTVARSDVDTDREVVAEVFDRDVYGLNGSDVTGLTVIDVGANIGAFALRAAAMGARVIAVEPEPGNRAVMCAALALLPDLAGRVDVVAAAVGAAHGSASTVGTGGGVLAVADPAGVTPMVTLDDLIGRAAGDVYLLKMDCESAEFDIIAAAERLADVRLIRMETHESNGGPRVGELVRKLMVTHEITHVSGVPMGTGYLSARRYGST